MIAAAGTTRRVVLAAALLTSGCDHDAQAAGDSSSIEKPRPVDKAPDAPAGPETIALDNGFVPDPIVVEGTTVGTRAAAELDPSCTGFISTEPSHVLEAQGTFADLHVLARGERDVSLIVERPDGTHVCAGTSGAGGPVIRASFSVGTYRLWVGAAQPDIETRYTLGLSELDDVTPQSLPN